MKINTLPNQTIMDVAIQYCGGLEAWPQIVALNNLAGLTAEVAAGTELIVPDPIVQRVALLYERGGYKPATVPWNQLEGIDYWFVYEYIVQ
jgi:hypothetical protein